MKFPVKKSYYKFKFDFEIGYLIKSPCKKCSRRNDYPACADNCKILDKIQTILSEGRSCSRRY